jgi:lipoate-protein ligase A
MSRSPVTEWRSIDSGPCAASHNMAVDEALALSVRNRHSPPVLRFYEWLEPSVTIGSFQKINSLNVSYCREHRIPLVRRLTGGRAILHGSELTYSLSARTDHGPFSSGLLDSYMKIGEAFRIAFVLSGLSPEIRGKRERGNGMKTPHCFHSTSFGEITLQGKKVAGAAQKRWRESFLQQGSLPFEIEREAILGIFGMQSSTVLNDRMIGLLEAAPWLDPGRLKEAIRSSFEAAFEVTLVRSYLSREERLLALEIEQQRYLSQGWNFLK